LVISLNKSFKRTLPLPVEYRKGTLRDLATLKFEDELSVSAASLEWNVLGVGHEFWIAAEGGVIIGVTVLAKEDTRNFKILHLEVAPSRKKVGVGSALLKAIIESYPQCSLSVIPFEGTEEFYSRLGFVRVGRWEMKFDSSSRR
jgi:N-acetylglutamate synthase-like GNAT family acetyltransferase